MSSLRVDHVTVAGRDLGRLRDGFSEAGLPSVYGGPHSNDVTHMATVGFPDGSYLELISTMEPERSSPLWDAHIAGDGGPAAWCAAADDIRAETARLRTAGIPVEGPVPYARRRPDGVRAEWDLSFPGDGPPGATLPFLIADRTPRGQRIRPDPAAAEVGVWGVAAVVLGVPSVEEAEDLFRRAYGWPAAERIEVGDGGPWKGDWRGIALSAFPEGPVVLAAPDGSGSWLAGRLNRFGPSPCAYLLSLGDPAAADRRLRLGEPGGWGRGLARWIDPPPAPEARVGLVWPPTRPGA